MYMYLSYYVLTGILDCEDKVEDNPDDEILTELRQKQQELKAVSNYVVSVTKTLLDKAREEMKKQELKKKLATADAEVKSTLTKLEILPVENRFIPEIDHTLKSFSNLLCVLNLKNTSLSFRTKSF